VSSNPAEDDGLRAIKICRTTSFGGKVKQSVPRRKILQHVKEPTGMKRATSYAKLTTFLAMFLLLHY
jgi:hypothetical protein